MTGRASSALVRTRRPLDVEPVYEQVVVQDLGERRVIFDDQDFRSHSDFRPRNQQRRGRADADLALLERPAMIGGNTTHDRQAQSVACPLACTPADEPPPHRVSSSAGMPAPRSMTSKLTFAGRRRADKHCFRGVGIAHCIVDQVVEREDERRAIGANRRNVGRHVDLESNTLSVSCRRNPCVASEMSASGSKVRRNRPRPPR